MAETTVVFILTMLNVLILWLIGLFIDGHTKAMQEHRTELKNLFYAYYEHTK